MQSTAYPTRNLNFRKIIILLLAGLFALYIFSATTSSTESAALQGSKTSSNYARLSDLLSVSVELSKKSADVIKDVHSQGKEAEKTKIKGQTEEGVDEPVTEADAKSNAIIVNGLRQKFPGINILSEEVEPPKQFVQLDNVPPLQLSKDRNMDLRNVLITVDPLDATKEFTEDLLEYVTTMVCVTEYGRPVAGIINQVFTGDIVIATVPSTPLDRGEILGMTVKQATGEAAETVTVSRSHTGDALTIVDKYLDGKKSLPAGGAGYKALLVARGEADAYVHVTKIKVWDVCSAEALIRAAGGKFTDSRGEDLEYTKDSVVISHGLTGTLTPENHQWYIDHLRQAQ